MIDVYADMLGTSDLIEATAAGQRFKIEGERRILAIKATLWLQDPEFAGLKGSIWKANAAGESAVKIADSDNSWGRAQVLATMNHGLKEFYFEFSAPNGIPVAAGEYVFRMYASIYVFSAEHHLAWKKSYPAAVYKTGLPPAVIENMPSFPREIVVIGDDLVL